VKLWGVSEANGWAIAPESVAPMRAFACFKQRLRFQVVVESIRGHREYAKT
jgi:hypothetical protein